MNDALMTGLGAIIASVLFTIRDLVKTRWHQDKVERIDAIQEWKDLTDRLQARVDQLQEAMTKTSLEMIQLNRDHARCQTENAELRGDIKLLQSTVQRLQGITGDDMPSFNPAIIVADPSGKIRLVSPGIAPMLHYLPAQLVGKNIEMLIPESLKEKHSKALQVVRETGKLPWTENTLTTLALSREGKEVPVTINLYGWPTENNDFLIAAEIRRRAVS